LHGRGAAVAETPNVNPFNAVTPFRPRSLAPLALACMLAACTSTTGLFSGESVDYKNASGKSKALDVPPDLTQLARDSGYQPRGGVVSASTAAAPTSAAAAAAPGATTGATPGATPAAAPTMTPVVALARSGDLRIERDGRQRWLVAAQTPELLWPKLRTFWEQLGFEIEVENAPAGVMETNWSENRAKLPKDAVRNTLGSLLGNLYDTGERDRFRTRVERTAGGSEVYISHRGAEEVLVGQDRESTTWRARPNDPDLEAEMLSRLMVALGMQEEAARAAVAAAAPVATSSTTADAAPAATAPAKARAITTPGLAALEVDQPFDRAWRQVGLALDRSGFTVEDRDRTAGLYYVRYVDPKYAGQEGPGWWARMFGGGTNPQAAVRYRVALKGGDATTTVSVLTSAGDSDVGENGQRIAARLLQELR
jgi:outer membrane protein assembly factor BamC